MSPWFRRRRPAADPAPTDVVSDPVPLPEAQPPAADGAVEEPDRTGPLKPDRLDDALKRLRHEIPAPSEENPSGPSE